MGITSADPGQFINPVLAITLNLKFQDNLNKYNDPSSCWDILVCRELVDLSRDQQFHL